MPTPRWAHRRARSSRNCAHELTWLALWSRGSRASTPRPAAAWYAITRARFRARERARSTHARMPVAFLIVSLLGAALTLNAYRPLARHGALSLACFFAGWLVSELPLHQILGQVAFAALFAELGALQAWPGWLALAVALASCAALFYLLLDAHRSAAHRGALARRRAGRRFRRAHRDAPARALRPAPRRAAPARDALLAPPPAGRAHPQPRLPARARPAGHARHLPPPRRAAPLPRDRAGARRRVGAGQQGRAGGAPDAPPRGAGLGVRRDQLPAQPARDVSGPPGGP